MTIVQFYYYVLFIYVYGRREAARPRELAAVDRHRFAHSTFYGPAAAISYVPPSPCSACDVVG